MFQELKHQLNAVEIYELKIKALQRDLDFVQHLRQLQQTHIETLQESIKDFKNE